MFRLDLQSFLRGLLQPQGVLLTSITNIRRPPLLRRRTQLNHRWGNGNYPIPSALHLGSMLWLRQWQKLGDMPCWLLGPKTNITPVSPGAGVDGTGGRFLELIRGQLQPSLRIYNCLGHALRQWSETWIPASTDGSCHGLPKVWRELANTWP